MGYRNSLFPFFDEFGFSSSPSWQIYGPLHHRSLYAACHFDEGGSRMLGTLVQGSSWQEKLPYKGAPQNINLFSCLRGKLPWVPTPAFYPLFTRQWLKPCFTSRANVWILPASCMYLMLTARHVINFSSPRWYFCKRQYYIHHKWQSVSC